MDRDTFLLLVCQNTYLLAWQKAEDKLPRLNKMNDAWPIGGSAHPTSNCQSCQNNIIISISSSFNRCELSLLCMKVDLRPVVTVP